VYKLDASPPATFELQTPPDADGKIKSYSKDACYAELSNTPMWFKISKYPAKIPSKWDGLLSEYTCFQLEASAQYFKEAELKVSYGFEDADSFLSLLPPRKGFRAKAWDKHFRAIELKEKEDKAKAIALKNQSKSFAFSTKSYGDSGSGSSPKATTWSKKFGGAESNKSKAKKVNPSKKKAKDNSDLFPDGD
jgi:hypothetical protein